MVGGMSGGTTLGDERLLHHRSVGLGHHGRGERGGGAVLGGDHGLEEHGEVALVGRRRVPVRRRRRRGIIRPVRHEAAGRLVLFLYRSKVCARFGVVAGVIDLRSGRVGLSHGYVCGRITRGKLQELEHFLLWENVGLTLPVARETAERRSRAI